MQRRGGEGVKGCTCIFQLSKFLFSGSSLGCFDFREREATDKGIKGQDQNPSYPLFSLTGAMADLVCLGP